MTKEAFYQLVAATGLDPRTLKRNGIKPTAAGDVAAANQVSANMAALSVTYDYKSRFYAKVTVALRDGLEANNE